MTLSPRQVRDLLDAHGLSPSRALGQNFVADPNTVRRIARLAEVGPGDRVVEIGPGLGSLTLALAETGADVTAVELDRHLLPALREVVEPHGVRIVHGDALRLDWDDVLGPPDPDRPWALVANLPYNVATPLVLDLLAGVPAIARMLVMVQREAGERLAADPGDKAYGIPSVKVALPGGRRGRGPGAPDGVRPAARGSSRPSSGSRGCGRRGSTPTRPACSGWWRPGSASAGRCCAGHSPGWWTRPGSSGRRPPRVPGRGARRRRAGPAWRDSPTPAGERAVWEGGGVTDVLPRRRS